MNQMMLKPQFNQRVFPWVWLCVVILSFALFIIGITIFLPVAIASLAFLFVIYESSWQSYTYAGVCLFVGLLLSFLFDTTFFVSTVCVVLPAALLAWGFIHRVQKFDLAMITIGVMVVLTLFALYLVGAVEYQSYVLSDVVVGYTESVSTWKEEWLTVYRQMISDIGMDNLYSESVVSDALDFVFALSLSALAVALFALVGISYKLFGWWVSAFLLCGRETVSRWKFKAPILFAYSYFGLFLLYLFSGTEMTAFHTVVTNLYIMLMVIFAYVGFKFMIFTIRRSRRPGLYITLCIFAILIFNFVCIELLSVEGVFAVLLANKIKKRRDGFFGGNSSKE